MFYSFGGIKMQERKLSIFEMLEDNINELSKSSILEDLRAKKELINCFI